MDEAEFYLAALHPDGNGGYGITFSDFPGCVSAGKTLGQAVANATEALAFHVEGMREDGDQIPAPLSDLPKYQQKTTDAIRDGSIDRIFPWPIRLFPAAGRSVRVQITMDARLLSQIDEVTSNRSRFLADAAVERLGKL